MMPKHDFKINYQNVIENTAGASETKIYIYYNAAFPVKSKEV